MTNIIAFVLPSLAGGGAEKVILSLIAGLDRTRFQPHLVLFEANGPLPLPPGIATTVLGKSRLRQAVPALVAELRHLRPAVTVSTFAYVNLGLVALHPLFGGRLLLREANLPSLSLPNSPLPGLLSFGARLLYPRADAIVATSGRMAAELRGLGVDPGRISILPNPVDEDRLRIAAQPARVAGTGPRFVAAGRFVHQKGFDALIPLLSGLADAHLTLLGEGPMRGQLAELAQTHRVAVDMPGFRDDAAAWFAGADALLLPSRWEGMPNVALEALACGTPVIATPESGGIGEVAAVTPPGAVKVAELGIPFRRALEGVTPQAPAALRASLLPPAYRRQDVVRRFEEMLAELV